MYCIKCGSENPDNAAFCYKCGTKIGNVQAGTQGTTSTQPGSQRETIASSGVTELKCPGCGAPIKPQQGEAVLTCEYCGKSISLGNSGWQNVSKHSMLSLQIDDSEKLIQIIKRHMDHGLMERHSFEESKEESSELSYVPYWIVPVSSNSSYKFLGMGAEIGTLAMDAAIMGAAGEMGRGRGMGGGMMDGFLIGGVMGGGMGGNNAIRGASYSHNYELPVVSLKGREHLQPISYSFNLGARKDFDKSKIVNSIKVLNGDIDEDTARTLAKTYADQEQEKAIRARHHHLEALQTQSSPGTPELLHVPVWVAKYTGKKRSFTFVIDGSNGAVIKADELKH